MKTAMILTVFLLSGVVSASSNPPPPAPAKTSKIQQKQPSKAENTSNDSKQVPVKPPIIVKGLKLKIPEEKATNHPNNSRKKTPPQGWEMLGFVGIFLTTFFTGIIAWFTAKLSSSTVKLWEETRYSSQISKKAADAAEKAAIASEHSVQAYIARERPWVSVDASISTDLSKTNDGIEFGVNFTIKNHGESPAVNVHIHYEVVTLKIGIDQFSDVRKRITDIGNSKQTGKNMGVHLFPSEAKLVKWKSSLWNKEIESALKSHTPPPGLLPSFYVVGSAFYQSAFSEKIHKTGFIYYVCATGNPIYPAGSDVPEFKKTFPMERIILDPMPYGKGTID